MREEWVEDPVRGYEENARHLLGYPDSTVREYVRDLRQFQAWLEAGEEGNAAPAESATRGAPAADARKGGGREEAVRPASGSGAAPREQRLTGGGFSDDRSSAPAAGRGVRLLAVTREEVEGWVVRLSDRGLRATTINRKLASLNSFYVWAAHHRLVERSPAAGIRKLKIPRRLPKFLTFEDIRALLGYTGSLRRTATLRGKQVHAMISILYHLGLRRQELVDLRFEHIEKVSEGEVFLHVFGKGDKQRLVPFVEPQPISRHSSSGHHRACRPTSAFRRAVKRRLERFVGIFCREFHSQPSGAVGAVVAPF